MPLMWRFGDSEATMSYLLTYLLRMVINYNRFNFTINKLQVTFGDDLLSQSHDWYRLAGTRNQF